jgi:hypothetical protein
MKLHRRDQRQLGLVESRFWVLHAELSGLQLPCPQQTHSLLEKLCNLRVTNLQHFRAHLWRP